MERLSPKFRSQQFFLCKICGEAFPPDLQRFVWRRHVGAHPDGHQHGGRKPTETPITGFCFKSVNLSIEELKNNKITVFPMQELFRQPNSSEINPEIGHFFTNSAVMQPQSLGSRAQSITKPRTHSNKNFYGSQFSAAILYIRRLGSIVLQLNFSDVI